MDKPRNQTGLEYANKRAREMRKYAEREAKDRRMRQVGATVEKYFGSNAPLISAMLGNIDVETGGTFDYRQEQKDGDGYGLFQFDFHRPYYFKFLRENGLEDSVDSQVRYVHENIFGSQQNVLGEGNADDLRKAFESDDPIYLSDSIMNIFLNPGVPHAERRRESTRMHSLAITPAK